MSRFYQTTKKFLQKLMPASLLFRYELPLRKIYALGFLGKTVQCNICQSSLSAFIRLETEDLLCPVCGSLPRHRRLWFFLQKKTLQGAVLHFSPARPLLRLLHQLTFIDYLPSDYEPNPLVKARLDITNIEAESESFSLIICYHVLEHIEADQKAMDELFRVLQPGGQLIVQTPFKEGDIYEDFSIQSPVDRLRHFGQEDHVRIYSTNGLKNRLEKSGFQVTILHFEAEVEINTAYGLSPHEKILICKKN